MANIHDCLQSAFDQGALSSGRMKAAQSEYEQLVARYETVMPRAAAEDRAAEAVKEASRTAVLSRRHKVIAQLQSAQRFTAAINQTNDPARALRSMLEYRPDADFTGESVEALHRGMVRSINSGIADVLRETGRNLTGRSKDRAKLNNVIDELHGQKTGDARAVELADAIRGQQSRMRKLFNAHGGDMGELDDYGVQHTHNAGQLRKANFQPWADFISERLDWTRITNHQTGKPFAIGKSTPPMRDVGAFLRDIYDGIVTRGWDDRDPSFGVGGQALYNSRSAARVLHFKDGATWREYNSKFGASDPFTSMINGLHGMARDIAQMRVLGPNPKMGLEFAIQAATKRASVAQDPKLISRVNASAAMTRTMLNHINGSNNMPVREGWARFFSGTRAVLVSTKLGTAPISAITDLATITQAANHVGIGRGRLLSQFVKLMFSPERRRLASRMGYVADTLAETGAGMSRYVGDTVSPEIAQRMGAMTMRVSGLSYWTDMARMAFQMEFAAMLGEASARGFDDLEPGLRELFASRGITPEDWDKLRDPSGLFEPRPGDTFLTPFHWLEHNTLDRAEAEGLGLRLQMLIEEQMEFGVPSDSVEGRSIVIGDSRPGTATGELLRSVGSYKSFTLSLTLNQIRRVMSLDTNWDRAKYATQLAAGLTLLGAVAVQLKETVKGRDPRPMDEPKFWMAALFQGGGLGIFGDFFSSETSRSGGGLAETIAGPVVGFASDVFGLVSQNVGQLVRGENPRIGRDLSQFQRYNTPVFSSLWYQRLAFDRLVSDQLQILMDPDAERDFRRRAQQTKRDYGTDLFWEQGELAPDRAPNLMNIGGSQ